MSHYKKTKYLLYLTVILIVAIPIQIFSQVGTVKIWEEELVLPTYHVDPPEKNPMFFENDSYQGASRVLYPYPLEDDFTNRKSNKSYKAVYIENEYIKLCILPEIGGRLFYATDKTNGYEMFYRQHVIKPAHIGMLGAWISGGIEFCVFHHHRATTNMPVDFTMIQNEDGSATLWFGETELRHRMKWTFGITLFPGKSYLELDGRMINSTENTNSILYWANVATHVNDDYQVIFPPSTNVTVFHAKNSFAHWPVTKEAYRGNTYYENNIDASWWKNHPGPNSLFAHDIKEGFLAGYDHGQKAGTMLVGNPNIVKGAKLWEWGNNSIWDTKVLTDNDGPYAEVMSGAYSDNQPDYSWIKPYEVKKFKQYWYPMRESQGASTATLNGLLTLSVPSAQEIKIAANTTSQQNNARLELKNGNKIIFDKQINISPAQPFSHTVTADNISAETELELTLYDQNENLLLSYRPQKIDRDVPLPDEVIPPAKPKDISTVEELYLTGLRIKQFHNARIDPQDYFKEALNRDPLDTRTNTQMGIIAKERGSYDEASSFFRKTLLRLTKNYTRPRDCEAFYHLGLILKAQGKIDAAYDTLYRAAWDHDFSSAAYFHLAQISTSRDELNQALIELDRSLSMNASNLNALNLKTSLLRKMGNTEEALIIADDVLDKDILNFWAHNEIALLKNNDQEKDNLLRLMRDNPESYLELAVGYLNAGLMQEAREILSSAANANNDKLATYPTIHYYLGYIADLISDKALAVQHFKNGAQQSTDYCFPFRHESKEVFETALSYNDADAKASYYLGNLLYDKQPEAAIQHWEKSVAADPAMAIALRNLGWAYYQAKEDIETAINYYEQAISHDPMQPRYFLELDELYEQRGAPIEKRYKMLNENHDVITQHMAPLIKEAEVSIAMGDYDNAIDILTNNYFNRREGRGNLHDTYVDAMLLRGMQHLKEKNWSQALSDFEAADLYPENQSIGRDEESERRAQIFYLQGLAYAKLGNKEEAEESYRKSTAIEVKSAEYNYQKAMAFRSLGEKDKSKELIQAMEEEGSQLLKKKEEIDFFSKFGGNLNDNKRKARAHYLLGLTELSSHDTNKASEYFNKTIEFNPGHAWARHMLSELK